MSGGLLRKHGEGEVCRRRLCTISGSTCLPFHAVSKFSSLPSDVPSKKNKVKSLNISGIKICIFLIKKRKPFEFLCRADYIG